MQYTLEAAKNSKLLDDIVVTTDSKKIIKLSKDLNINAPFIRPKKLSGYKVNMLEVIFSIANKKGVNEAELLSLRAEKKRTYGGFEIGLLCRD